MAFESTLHLHATPWWPEGSDAATGISEAHKITPKPLFHWAKHSGLGPQHDRHDVQPFSKKKSSLSAHMRAQLHGMTWNTGKLFAYIHSGSNGWAGGVLTIVRRYFSPQERISWRAVKKGCILHVRLYMSCTSKQDGIVKVVDQNDHSCPLHLNVCSQSGIRKQAGSADLHATLLSWSEASFGLHAMVSSADPSCIQLDCFGSFGQNGRTRVLWSSKVWMPFFIGPNLDLDNIPYEVCALAFYLGSDYQLGHNVSVFLHGGNWWANYVSDDPKPFKVLPPVLLENGCMPWLKCLPHGGAELATPPADEALILITGQQIQNVTTDQHVGDPWFSEWLQAQDRLDTKFPIDHPEPCHRLVKICFLCQTWPANLNDHMASLHMDLRSQEEPQEEICAERFLAAEPATRWYACQPYQRSAEDEREIHSCACLRQFSAFIRF